MENGEERATTGLSSEAQAKLEQFIKVYDPINNRALRQNGNNQAIKDKSRDNRLPVPGSVISKVYKGDIINVNVLDKGFEYDGKVYRTLSSVAGAITGQHWNGYLFFCL
jgi:hypothetical protein